MKPQLTETQTNILKQLADGWQCGQSHSGGDGRFWLQKGGAGRGGESQKLKLDDFEVLRKHRLIYKSKDSFPTSTWDITESGTALLQGKWTDAIHQKVASILANDGRPIHVIEAEKAHLPPEEHPSYGLVSIHHISGGKGTLFRASIEHNERLSLRISPAKISRSHSHESVHAIHIPHIEVEMSADQFLGLILNTNKGDGVPCTIVALKGETIPAPKLSSPRADITKRFEKTIEQVTDNADALRAEARRILTTPGTLKAEDKAYLHSILERLVQDVRENVPFINKQFQETLDASVAEASAQLAQQVPSLPENAMPKLMP